MAILFKKGLVNNLPPSPNLIKGIFLVMLDRISLKSLPLAEEMAGIF